VKKTILMTAMLAAFTQPVFSNGGIGTAYLFNNGRIHFDHESSSLRAGRIIPGAERERLVAFLERSGAEVTKNECGRFSSIISNGNYTDIFTCEKVVTAVDESTNEKLVFTFLQLEEHGNVAEATEMIADKASLINVDADVLLSEDGLSFEKEPQIPLPKRFSSMLAYQDFSFNSTDSLIGKFKCVKENCYLILSGAKVEVVEEQKSNGIGYDVRYNSLLSFSGRVSVKHKMSSLNNPLFDISANKNLLKLCYGGVTSLLLSCFSDNGKVGEIKIGLDYFDGVTSLFKKETLGKDTIEFKIKPSYQREMNRLDNLLELSGLNSNLDQKLIKTDRFELVNEAGVYKLKFHRHAVK